jgi:hypothetical protein
LIKEVAHQIHILIGNSKGERCFACQGHQIKQRGLAHIQFSPLKGENTSIEESTTIIPKQSWDCLGVNESSLFFETGSESDLIHTTKQGRERG